MPQLFSAPVSYLGHHVLEYTQVSSTRGLMAKDRTVFQDVTYYRYPDSPYHNLRKYFVSTRGERLHRVIYETRFGPIPPNYDVHHKDFDASNNDPENLEAILHSEHMRLHNLTEPRLQAMKRLQRKIADTRRNSPDTNAHWRASISQAHQERYDNMAKIVRKCDSCGKEYECLKPDESKYCSSACSAAAYRLRVSETRACVVCGTEFSIPRSSPTKTCSQECAAKSWERTLKDVTCSRCGAPCLKSREGVVTYCSPACQQAARRESGVDDEVRLCAYCSAEFTVSKYSHTRACSLKCAGALRRKPALEQVLSPVSRTCAYCGATLEAENGDKVYGKKIYCSPVCKSAARRKSGVDNETRRCLNCGQEFTVDRFKSTQVCSRQCSWALWRSKKNGEI